MSIDKLKEIMAKDPIIAFQGLDSNVITNHSIFVKVVMKELRKKGWVIVKGKGYSLESDYDEALFMRLGLAKKIGEHIEVYSDKEGRTKESEISVPEFKKLMSAVIRMENNDNG